MNIPQYFSDRSDTAVALHRQARAVFLRIDTHAPEFIDEKYRSVLRQSLLLVEYRASVIKMHEQRNDQHER